MALYHATYSELVLGQVVTPRAPIETYLKAVAAIESAKPVGYPSRSLCVFASNDLAGVTKFGLKQKLNCEPAPLRVYEVIMNCFHKSPMRIVAEIQSRLEMGKAVSDLVREYWSPTLSWSFWEFFGPSFTPVAEVAPAGDDKVMVFDHKYLGDGENLRHFPIDAQQVVGGIA